MKNKYAVLKQVIDLYEEYELRNRDLELGEFVRWMSNKLIEEPALDEGKVTRTSNETSLPLINRFDDKVRFLEITARIARYHEFYIRKALKDLIINNRLEYLFLQTVEAMEKAKKTDLINIYHLEYTTGMDTIRRLINNGLLSEVQDKTDKRIKLLELSDLGREVLDQAKRRVNDEAVMFFTPINDNKWKKALPVLEEIDRFHDAIYQKHSGKPFAELSNLMDSLSHLTK